MSQTALLVIDMENAFVLSGAPQQVKMALATVPAIEKVIKASRKHGIPVIYIKRVYRNDGSDVEITRWARWKEKGRSMTFGSTGPASAEYVESLKPESGDYLLVKKRWSAFFRTELDILLHRLGVDTVVLTGTQTPNCIRTTAYDANSLDFEVIIIEDGTSSNTQKIQDANILDLKNLGCIIMNSDEYVAALPDLPKQYFVERIREDMEKGSSKDVYPQPIESLDEKDVGYVDRW